MLTCLPVEQVQLRSQTKIWATYRQTDRTPRVVRLAASYLLHTERKHFASASSDARGALPPEAEFGVPYKAIFYSAVGTVFLMCMSAYVLSFSLAQHTNSHKRENHAAATELSLCLATDLVFTFPLFIFFTTVICPHIAAQIVHRSRLQHEARHDTSASLKNGSMPVVIAQRLSKALERARARIADREHGQVLAPEGLANRIPVFILVSSFSSALGRARARIADRHGDSTSNRRDDAATGEPETLNPITDEPQAEWVAVEDPVSHMVYFYNTVSGETSWESPLGGTRGGVATGEPSAGTPPGTSNDEALPNQWVSMDDPTTQSTYYYNTETGESRWESPKELAHDDDIELGDLYPATVAGTRNDDDGASGQLSNNPLQQSSVSL